MATGGGFGMATGSGGVVGGVVPGQGIVTGGGGNSPPSGGVISSTVINSGGAGCAGTCGGAEVACCDADGAVTSVNWKFVGGGAGNYNKVQTYSYVGEGGGAWIQEEVVTKYGWKVKPSCIGLLVLLLIVIIAVMFWPQPKVTTTTTIAPPTPPPTTSAPIPTTVEPYSGPEGTCLFWGDPHILTFDGARPSFYGEGEFWIVKSSRIQIQGQFMGTKYTHGLSATYKIAVGGPFLNGQVIEVGTMEAGPPTVNGVPVLQNIGSTYSLGARSTLTYNAEGELPDKAASVFPKNVVHMDLPSSVKIEVFRWSNYIDLRIKMRRHKDQDGCCGNFNMNPADDTTSQIFARVGARVPQSESLFSTHVQTAVTSEMQQMIATNCPPATLNNAKVKCQSELSARRSADRAELDACVFDNCFGKNEHALRTAKTYR